MLSSSVILNDYDTYVCITNMFNYNVSKISFNKYVKCDWLKDSS